MMKKKFEKIVQTVEDDIEEYFPEESFRTSKSSSSTAELFVGDEGSEDSEDSEFTESSGIFDELDFESVKKLKDLSGQFEKNLDSKGILIVDDEPMILTLIQKYLEKIIDDNTKKKIVIAKDGRDAVQKLLNQEFGLIIVDLEMPRMHGFELIKLLKAKNKTKKVPILIISGNLYQKSVKEAVYLGVKEILAKPFTFKTFTDRIRRVLKITA